MKNLRFCLAIDSVVDSEVILRNYLKKRKKTIIEFWKVGVIKCAERLVGQHKNII